MTKSLENNDFLKGFGRSSCFQTLLKRESVYKHEKWTNPLKIITFSRDLVVFLFLCVTKVIISVFKEFGSFLVSGHFPFSKVSGNRRKYQILETSKNLVVFLFLDTFHFQKYLETGESTKSLKHQRIWSILMFIDTFPFQKCLETGKTTKSFEKIIIVKGFVISPV